MRKGMLRVVLATAWAVCGAAAATEKAPKTRSWMGGAYETLRASADMFCPRLPEAVRARQKGAVLATAIYPSTPAAAARIRAGDLIVALDRVPVTRARDLYRWVDRKRPGDAGRVEVFRDGAFHELTMTLGRERFEIGGSFMIGLRVSSRLDLIPDRDFSLFVLDWKRESRRADLAAPGAEYVGAEKSTRGDERGMVSEEGWRVWAGPFGLRQYKRILSQERVDGG